MNRASLFSAPPLWREAGIGLELAALLRDPVHRGVGAQRGDGEPVLLIPGFLAGDDSLGVLTRWLRRIGYRTQRAGIRSNVDCSAAAIERLVARLESLADRSGDRVAVVGQSRGGSFARVLAVQRPDLVAGIVTLGSPHVDPLAVHPLVRLQLRALSSVGRLGVRGLVTRECLDGECCAGFRASTAARFPDDVGFVSIYSRRDGIVDWRACLDPAADNVEIDSTHCGMSVNAAAYRAIAAALPGFRAEPGSARTALAA